MKKAVIVPGCLPRPPVLTGCSTVEEPYIPQTVGSARLSHPEKGIRLTLSADDEVQRLGDPLTLRVTMSNEGSDAIWVPGNPHLIMVWVYPTGRNDNTMQDPPRAMHFTRRNAVLLEPGQALSKDIRLDTYYFPRAGITEFRAVLNVPGSTNPALKPFWAGRAISNPFGVLIVEGDDPYATRRADRASGITRHPS